MPPFPPPDHPRLPIPSISLTITIFSIIVISLKKNRFTFDRWFALFLISLSSLHIAHLVRKGLGEEYFDFFHISILLFGPLFFLYLKDIMGIKIKKKDLIHCIPYLLSIAFFFVLHFSKDLLFTENLYYDLFGRKNWILKGLSFFSLLIYSSFSLYKVYKLEKDMTNPVVEPLQFNWLKSIIGLMIIIILYHGLSGLLNEPSGYFPLFFLPSIRGYDILIFTILFSLFGVRHSMVHSAWLLDQGFLSQSLKKKKYEKSGLEIEKLKDYVHAVKDYMEVRKPYLANEFSLDDLADYLDIPRAHITQALNEVLETNFYHFVNEYRIREFISVLESSGEEKPNFLSLAFGVGFNSKSTFNDSFKRITGSTPSLYFVEKKRKNRS